MNQLLNAIALEVAFQQTGFIPSGENRALHLYGRMTDLATRSDVPVTEVTFYHVVEAFTQEWNCKHHAEGLTGFVVHNPDGYQPSTYHRTFYARECDAKRQTAKLRGRGYPDIGYSTASTYHRSTRFVLRRNLMSKALYVEAEGTPGYCSPSTESYWSM